MKKLTSEKIFKATLATAVAAGAFVAVAPVNTEAATFKDVTTKTSHYDAIMYYTDKGMISGFPDGTFKQGQAITRQDAAKLLALALELDLDNVKDPGFKDVSRTNPNYKYIAALVEKEIISGYEDNTFKPTDNLSRAQMAKILVLGFELEDEGRTSLPFKDINERQWHIEFVRTLYSNKITTGTTSTTFSPNELVTRGQMAAFAYRSESAAGPKQSEVDKATVDAIANKLTAGTVTVSRGASATDANKLAAVQTYINSLVADKSVKVTVAASTTAGNYVVTVTKGEAKAEKTIAMTFNNAADDRFVTEVTAINAKQVAIKFATPVTKASVLNSSNEVQNMTFTMVSGSTVNPGKLTGSLSEDGKTLTITANWIFDGEYAFKSTDKIQSVAGGKFEEYTSIIKANDKEAPKLISGSAVAKVSTNSFAVFFDEPVSAVGATAYVDGAIATVVNNPSDPNRLDVTANKYVATGATATIKMLNVKDHNKNLLAPNPAEVSVTVSADTIAPTVTQVNVLGENKVEVVYDKNMNLSSFSGKARLVYSNGTVTNLTATVGANAKTIILTGTGLPVTNNYSAILFIDADVKDTVGNSTLLYSSNVTLSKDTTPPVMASVEYKDGKIIATFTEDIVLGRQNALTVIDQNGQSTQITLDYNKAVITNNTLSVAGYLPNGTYQLRLPAHTVTDKASIPNANLLDMQSFVVQNSLSTDNTRPVVGKIESFPPKNGADQTVTYTVTDYDSGVNLASVQEISNYTWDNSPLPWGSYVTTDARSSDKATVVNVTIHIPSTNLSVNKQAQFAINNIRDNSGNTIGSAAVQNIYLYGNNINGIGLRNAAIDAYDGTSLLLSFNQNVYPLNTNDFTITLNDQIVQASSIASITPSTNNTFAVKIKASEANDIIYYNTRRSAVHYFDVNNNGVFEDWIDEVITVVDYGASNSTVHLNLNAKYVRNLKVNDYQGQEVIVKR